MRGAVAGGRRLLWVVLGLLWAGCDPIPPVDEPEPLCAAPPVGVVCYQDSDCVPDGCCGLGSCAVHESLGPSCSGVRCDGTCPAGTVDCGCGIPVCREGRCTVARTVSASCPG
jgi:hypothetical protein